jgi:hypothetical protein
MRTDYHRAQTCRGHMEEMKMDFRIGMPRDNWIFATHNVVLL